MSMRFSMAAVLAAALAALAVGCGSDDDDAAGSTGSEAGGAAATSAMPKLAGDYRRNVTRDDIMRTDELRRAGAQEAGAQLQRPEPGPAALTLADGTLTMTDPRADLTIAQDFSATSDGAFRIGAYQHPEKGSFCGPEVPQTASYSWTLSDGVLTLRAKDDPCADRDSTLSGEWKAR